MLPRDELSPGLVETYGAALLGFMRHYSHALLGLAKLPLRVTHTAA